MDITDEKIIGTLQKIISNIKDGKYTKEIKEEIFECVEEFSTGERKPLDSKIVEYLFMGWWVKNSLYNTEI